MERWGAKSPHKERNAEICRVRADEGLSYRAIGERFGISKDRVRQVLIKGDGVLYRGRLLSEWREIWAKESNGS